MEYCCHVEAGAHSWRICRTVGPSLATLLESLTHRRNLASLSLSYRYYFGRCSSELPHLVPLPHSPGKSTRYSDRMHDFSVTIPRCCKNVLVNNFFPRTAKVLKFLPVECFPLNYDLNSGKPRTNQHLLKPFCTSFSCNSIACSGCPALHGVNPDWKDVCYISNVSSFRQTQKYG